MDPMTLSDDLNFDIDVELPPELDAPWADEADVVSLELGAAER